MWHNYVELNNQIKTFTLKLIQNVYILFGNWALYISFYIKVRTVFKEEEKGGGTRYSFEGNEKYI
jgi:hypothetical protein